MTRDEMIEVMARAYATRWRALWIDAGLDAAKVPSWEELGPMTKSATLSCVKAQFSALEAAGYVVVKKDAASEALTMMTDGSAVSQWVVDDFVAALASQQEKADG